MFNSPRRRLAWLAAASLFVPASLFAKTPTQAFADLPNRLKISQTVVVTDATGQTTKGKVAGITASSLDVLAPDRRTLPSQTINKISRTDSPLNGTLIGAGVGIGASLLWYEGAMNSPEEGSIYVWYAVGSWLAPLAGTLLGFLIDRQDDMVPIYVAPPRKPRPSVTVAPVVARKAPAVLVMVRF